MFRSKDGFTFEKYCLVEKEQSRDTQAGVIKRGNVCKVYHRGWKGGYPSGATSGYGGRCIVVFYMDEDGNILCQETPVVNGYYYNSAASVIDDRREVLIPTYYYGESEDARFDAYIVDGTRITQVEIDSDKLLKDMGLKWGLFCCGIIATEGKTYMYYVGTTVTHNGIPTSASRTSAVYRVEIKFKSNKLRY
jgi:hypothetical protein